MLAALIALAAAPDPVLVPGDRIEATVVVRSINRELDLEMRERETWTFAVVKADAETITVELSRRLLETAMGDAITAAPPTAVRTLTLVLTAAGELRYRPFAETPLEGRLFRIVEALLPKAPAEAAGRAVVEFAPNERERLPAAAFSRTLRRRAGGLVGSSLSYREPDVRALGEASLDARSGLPLLLSLRLTGLTLPGGSEPVTTEFSLLATRARLRGKEVALPEPPKSPASG